MILTPSEQNPFMVQELSEKDVTFLQSRSFKNFNTMIGIPTRGMIHYQILTCWRTLMMPMNSRINHTFAAGFEVGDARNNLVQQFLADKHLKYLMFFDDDILMKPESFLKLARAFSETDYDILGGIYRLKDGSRQQVAYRRSEDGYMESITDDDMLPEKGNVIDLDIIGMGFTCIKRSVLEKVEAPWFRTSDLEEISSGQSFTEDVFFCRKAKEAGFKIGAVPSITLGHLDTKSGIVY